MHHSNQNIILTTTSGIFHDYTGLWYVCLHNWNCQNLIVLYFL